MMEPQEVILSKLVLGYLKSEKCKSAYREFLKTSSHLQQLDLSNSKYIGTRFLGLTLEDILSEYSDISQIIQGRLEATNYYNEDRPKESLVNQLLYLLSRVPSSRPSTPGYSTPHSSHVDDRSPSHVDHSDLDTTRADALPGNTPNEKSYSPRRKTLNRYGKPAPVTSSPIEKGNKSELFDTEMLAESLLENKEFHKKIAQTINKVVERQVDSTVKQVIQETEQDPIFDKILDEIIGTSNNMIGISKESDCNNATNSTANNSKESKDKMNDLETPSKSYRSGKEKQETIKQPYHASNVPINAPQPNSENNEVANFEGNLDNYMLTSQCGLVTNHCLQNPIYINTVTGVLIPPLASMDSTKSFVVLNKPPPPCTPAILTEQDIMKMPIILKEDNPAEIATEKQEKGVKPKTKNILPKAKIKVELGAAAPTELKDYFKNYKPESSESTKATTGLKRVMYPKTKTRKSPNPLKKSIAKSNPHLADKNSLTNLTTINENKEEDIIDITSSESKVCTPKHTDTTKKSTPKSGSHVRNLDFSTPTKINLPRRKLDDAEHDAKSTTDEKTAAKTLFKQAEPQKIWDADLRLIIQKDVNITTPKKQLNTKKNKRKVKKTTKLNSTEQDGLLLEAAIKTPIKNKQVKDSTQDVKEPEMFDDKQPSTSQGKTILSPSKLNASKHQIVDTQNNDENLKIITPDMVKQNVAFPITTNRNINSLLETPLNKQIPKTPGILTPLGFNDDGTPFYDMIKANLNGMDLNSIQTPSVLMTPGNFPPITPNIDLISPYENRPTDYSTGSSYYQPSDNEQNKNLEAHIRKVEKSSGPITTTPELLSVNNHLQIFNKNVIGKKNLNLIKKNLDDSENSSYHSSDEKQEESSIEYCEKESNETIFKKKIETPKRTYSLRTRKKKSGESPKKNALNSLQSIRKARAAKKETKKSMAKNKIEDINLKNEQEHTDEIKSVISPPIADKITKQLKLEPNSEEASKGVSASQYSVLKELEQKRLRTVNSFKNKTELMPKPKKQLNGKFKIKPIAKVYTTKTGKKIETPRKRKRAKDLETVMNDLITSDDSDVNLSLRDEDEEDQGEEKDKEELLTKEVQIDKFDKTASDVEAQNLIEGLKERGIHLMHNKSPKKKILEGKEIINTSDLQLETFERDYFDTCSKIGEDICMIHDETKIVSKPVSSQNDLKKIEYIGKLYLESINKEIDIKLKLTPLLNLIDIQPQKQKSEDNQESVKVTEHYLDEKPEENKQNEENMQEKAIISLDVEDKSKVAIEKNDVLCQKSLEPKISATTSYSCQSNNDVEVDDDLMNFAVSGKEKNNEESLSPRRSKKRRLSDESESENSRTKILKTLDVDSFLNTIHYRPKQ